MIVTAECRRAQNVIGAVEQAPDDYLLKPFTGEALSKRLDKAIRKKTGIPLRRRGNPQQRYLRAIEECNQRIGSRDEYTLDFMKLKGRLLLQIGDYPAPRQVYNWPFPRHGRFRGRKWASASRISPAALRHRRTAVQEVLQNGQVMEAYDWLAKPTPRRPNTPPHRQSCKNAVKLSPTIVNRQKSLGEVAQKKDFSTSPNRHSGDTIDLAKYSFWRDAGNHATLSKVQLDQGRHRRAQKTLAEVRRDFKQDQKASMLSYVMEANVSQKLGDHTAAKLALDMAQKQMSAPDGQVPDNYALEFAEAYRTMGGQDVPPAR